MNYVVAGSMALLFLLGFGIWAYFETKKTQMEFGRVMHLYMIKYQISIFFIFIIIINTAEAAMAASISPVNQVRVNAVSKFLSQFSIMLVSILAAFSTIKSWAELFSLLSVGQAKKKNYIGKVIVVLFATILVSLITIIAPAANAILIANGLGETVKLQLLIQDWGSTFGILYSKAEYYNNLAKHGLPITYSPSGDMSNVMLTTVFMTLSHYILVFWEALEALKFSLNNEKKEEKIKNDEKALIVRDAEVKQEEKEVIKEDKRKDTTFENTVTEVLKFYGLKPDDINRKVTIILNTLNSSNVSVEQRVTSSAAVTTLYTQIAKVKSDKEISELKTKIYDLFNKPIRSGGLGMTLPVPKN